MTAHRPRLRLALVALTAGLIVGCGSQVVTPPPATAPASPAPTLATPVTPAVSPTPVPASPSDAAEDGVFRTRLFMPDGTYELQVVLRDATDLVAAIGASPPGNPAFDESIENPDGQPDALVYTWLGGACDTVTTITFERTGSRFRLRGTTATRGDMCILIGLSRQLLIRLREPLDASLVNLAEE